MPNVYTCLEHEVLYRGKETETFHFGLTDDVFLSFVSEKKSSCCVFIANNRVSIDIVKKLLKEVEILLESPSSHLKMKMVSNEVGAEKIESILLTLNLHLFAKKITTAPKTNLYFYPYENRVRVDGSLKDHASSSVGSLKPIKIAIVDDSKTIRTLLRKVFALDPQFEVIWEADDPTLVPALIERMKPDVMTLDIHMPKMNGVELLKRILSKAAIPCVVITSLGKQDGPLVFDALENGAVDYIQKPAMSEMETSKMVILESIRAAASAKVQSGRRRAPRVNKFEVNSINHSKIVAIGASTGGTEALKEVLLGLPTEIPPILIVQHIPPVFSSSFANRLNELCPFEVREGVNGDEVKPGRVLIAPGGLHMTVVQTTVGPTIRIDEKPSDTRHRPSVDVLFHSVAQGFRKNAIGVILTGMGNDGAQGLLEMKQQGARTIAQNERTCAVFGMPNAAIKCGAVDEVLPLEEISLKLTEWLSFTTLRKAL